MDILSSFMWCIIYLYYYLWILPFFLGFVLLLQPQILFYLRCHVYSCYLVCSHLIIYMIIPGNRTLKSLSDKEIGLAKLSGFREWFSNHFILREPEDASTLEVGLNSQKMIIFGHHLKVLDEVQVNHMAQDFLLLTLISLAPCEHCMMQ